MCKDINQLKGNGFLLLETRADDITSFWGQVYACEGEGFVGQSGGVEGFND